MSTEGTTLTISDVEAYRETQAPSVLLTDAVDAFEQNQVSKNSARNWLPGFAFAATSATLVLVVLITFNQSDETEATERMSMTSFAQLSPPPVSRTFSTPAWQGSASLSLTQISVPTNISAMTIRRPALPIESKGEKG